MQCIILAAGKGMRMRPLTNERPKPLVEVLGKPLLFHILERLPNEVTELIIVVGYKGEQITKRLGKRAFGRPISYVWQNKQQGTADALGLCKERLHGKFLLLNADDIYDKESLSNLIQKDLALLAKEHEHPEWFGVIKTNKDGTLEDIIEKPAKPPTNLVSTGAMVLDRRIFNYKPTLHENGEYYIPTQLKELAREYPVHIVHATTWVPVGKPEDIPLAERILYGSTG